MLGVAHNILAMNAQRQYKINTDSKKKSTEKLSSGYRINRAADDAAGLTISEKMRSMIRGLNQGTDNTHDGVSFVQVADGAMNEIHDMLHRLEELAVKAANGTLTDADRQACNVEAQQILDQIDQIDYFTEFNTLDVFAKGDVTLSVKGEPGELEVFGGTDENGNYTYGGYLFHGKRIPFSEINGIEHGGTPISDGMVKMVNGQQVFKAGIYSYKDEETGCFFEIEIAKDSVTPDAKRNIKIDAKLDGLYVDGYKIDWSDVKDEDGIGVSESNLHTGAYKFNYGGAETTIDVRNGSVVRNMTYFCASINSMTNLNENGGTSYQWITNHAFNVWEYSVSNFDFGFDTVENKKRTIDNEFAYDTQNDNYDGSLSNGKVEFTIRTEYTSYDAVERAKYGTDDDTNFALYLTGNENQDPGGSSDAIEGTVMSMADTGIDINSWSKGEDVTDGDGLIGTNTLTGDTDHYWNDDNLIPKDGVTDKTYIYDDQGTKTDLTFSYNLSDITSADTVKNSLNGEVIKTEYSSSYHDEMACDLTVDGNISYTSENNGREDFWVSYDVETALGRDFNEDTDTLATVYGNQVGSEGSGVFITYNGQVTGSTAQTITFKIQGNVSTDKTAETDFEADRIINNIDVFTFTADTSRAENNITNDIVRASTEIISNKINEVLSGRASDGSASVSKDAQGVSLKYNVGLQSGSAGSTDGNIYDRQYYYSYEYNDMLDTLNYGTDNVSSEGEKIVVYMDNLGTLESYNYAWENKSADILNERYLHLTLDGTKADDLTYKGGSWAKGSYISLRDFYNNMSDGLTKTKAAIYNDKNVYNEISNKYTTDTQYKEDVKTKIKNSVNQLIDAFNADPTAKYLIKSDADAAALFDSLGITGFNDEVLEAVKNQFIKNVSHSNTPQSISGLDISIMFLDDDVNKMASNIVSNAKVLGAAASPAITSDNMKELISNALNRVIPSNDVETAVKNMTQAVLADSTAWARAFDKITVENGHIQYVSEATISKLADYYSDDGGIVYDLRAYYGGDDMNKQNDTDITVKDIKNYANHITSGKAVDTAILNDAKTYSSNALNNIALSSVYTLQANRASTVTAGNDFSSEKSSRAIYESEIEIESKEPMKIQHSGVQNDFTEINKFNISTAAMKIQSLRLDTQNWARRALEKLDGAMAYASEKRSYLGAVQNRLEHTLRNNENKAENLTDAESRIRDTDMAEEMVNLTKQNILTQVGEAMISQANQSNQGVLTLLGS